MNSKNSTYAKLFSHIFSFTKITVDDIYWLAWEYWSVTDIELHNVEEAVWIRLAHDIRMKKDPQTKKDTLSIFKDFHGVMWVQSPTWTPARKFYQWRR